jgi:subtilisin family serine protease
MNWYDELNGWWVRSNYGSWVDVAAPGQRIYTTTPTYHVTYNDYGMEYNYDYGTGTSASGPIVAGIAGLLLSRDPTLSPDEIKTLICENIDPYDSEYDLGSGRVNAHKAVADFYNQLDIEITGGLDVGATITYNGLGDVIGEPYEMTVTGGILGLINKTINGTIDIESGATQSISSGLLFGLGGIDISVRVGVKEEIAEGMQLFIFTIV